MTIIEGALAMIKKVIDEHINKIPSSQSQYLIQRIQLNIRNLFTLWQI